MNLFGTKKIDIKRKAAAALAVVMSLTMFGVGTDIMGGKGSAVISGYAAEAGDDLDKQLAEIEKKQAELDKRIAAAGDDIQGREELLKAVNEKAAEI